MSIIWNPQTVGQKLISRMLIPTALRDNAPRDARLRWAFAIFGIGMWANYLTMRNRQLKNHITSNDGSVPAISDLGIEHFLLNSDDFNAKLESRFNKHLSNCDLGPEYN